MFNIKLIYIFLSKNQVLVCSINTNLFYGNIIAAMMSQGVIVTWSETNH